MTSDIRVPAGVPTGGQFATHNRHESDVSLRPTADARFVRQAWGANDYLIDLDQADVFDATPFLDAATLDDVASGDLDWVAFDAIYSGAVDEHDGPFNIEIAPEVLDAYIAAREEAGQTEAITAPVPYTQSTSAKVVKKRLNDAASRIAESFSSPYSAEPFMPSVSEQDVYTLRTAVSEAIDTLAGSPSEPSLHPVSQVHLDDAITRLTVLRQTPPGEISADRYAFSVAATAAMFARTASQRP